MCKYVLAGLVGLSIITVLDSLTSHTLCREEGSGHTATIELSSQENLNVTNQIRTLRR